MDECEKQLDLVDSLIIVGVKNKSKIFNSPDNPKKLALNLSVLASQDELVWIVNGKKIGQSESNQAILLSDLDKGHYAVMVFNPQGQKGLTEFEVL